MEANATFEVSESEHLPTADDVAKVVDVELSHTAFTKTFRGDLEGSSITQMLASRSPGGAGYVAMERIVGRLGARVGTFVLLHLGTLDGSRPQPHLWWCVSRHGCSQ